MNPFSAVMDTGACSELAGSSKGVFDVLMASRMILRMTLRMTLSMTFCCQDMLLMVLLYCHYV